MEEKFFEIEDGVLTKCTGNEKDVVIPEGVTKIEAPAFTGSPFWPCESLETVHIPLCVTELGHMASFRCTSLKSIDIPDSVTIIGFEAFDGCASLASVSIPASVAEIGMYAFSGCTSLEEVRYTGTKEEWAAVKKEENWKAGVPARKMTCADRKALFK